MLLNTITILVAYVLTAWFFYSRTQKGKWPCMTLTAPNLCLMSIKLLLIYLLVWIICWYFHFNALIILSCIGLLILLMRCDDVGLSAPILVIGYILLQWILGFPDKELWIPPNKRFKQTTGLSENLLGKIGTTKTPLRPTGYILVENKEYLAKSEIVFIDKDQSIEITGINNGTLTVNTFE